ncbi:MAG: class I SAM-dependent methyltransferase [Gammaproteobacteria bacterium]|nr:class I SAM-dependent methyltransferase [Gammaproteobacteria bacterium]
MAATAKKIEMKTKQKNKRGYKKKLKQADSADRHVLYEAAVQDAEAEVDFAIETFEELRKREPRILREDFCGTANVACEWVRRNRKNHAYGVDLDSEVLAWGREHHVAKLDKEARKRVHLIEGDVLSAGTKPADVAMAMNFSYWTFKTRPNLRNYFENVRSNLAADGIFIMDVFGGHDAYKEMKERRDCDGFTYVWNQADYDPVSGNYTCHISFEFPDRSRLKNAFTYHWRLWSMPEIRELLSEAGFRQSTVYWQGTDDDTGEGDGEFEPVIRGEADPAWICYIVAEK